MIKKYFKLHFKKDNKEFYTLSNKSTEELAIAAFNKNNPEIKVYKIEIV